MRETLLVLAASLMDGAPGDIKKNQKAILERIKQAKEKGADALVLPELCLSSVGAGSLFLHDYFLDACFHAAQAIAQECVGLVCVFGLPIKNGTCAQNALAVAYEGQIQAFVIKQTKRGDQALFFDADCPEELIMDGRAIPCAPTVHLPLPLLASAVFYDDLSSLRPEANLVLAAASVPAQAGQINAASLYPDSCQAPYLAIANAGANESTTDLVYPGQAVIFRSGEPVAFARPFLKETAQFALAANTKGAQARQPAKQNYSLKMPYAPQSAVELQQWCEDAVDIAAQALLVRMRRINIKAVTLGVSGGLDSAMALLTCLRTFELGQMDKVGIYAFSLPGLGSSKRTKANARRLMEAFDLIPREVDLRGSILKHFEDIEQSPLTHDAAYENAQARERTQFLMDKANQVQGMMVGSGDLSELALGFTTFNGDHMSMYGVNGGLYKTAIRLILRHFAEKTDKPLLLETLMDILDTPISPELLPGGGDIAQKTEDILGPYELNDYFLHHFLSGRHAPQDLINGAEQAFLGQYTQEEIKSRLRAFFKRFFTSQFKRNCLPDGPSILGVSLSPRGGLTLPSDMPPDLYMDLKG